MEIEWRVNPEQYAKVVQIIGELLDEEEWSENYFILLDQLKSIPGYPLFMDEGRDILIIAEVGTPFSAGGLSH